MPEEWLIDGYNLLHSALSAGEKGSDISLPRFFSRIADLASSQKHLILMVLDGSGNDKELDTHRTSFFRVVYSKKISADAYIERYLFENRSRATMTVVTNDRAIIDLARGGGARVLSTAEFSELLQETKLKNADILFKEKVKSHGFNRPFDQKLKDK